MKELTFKRSFIVALFVCSIFIQYVSAQQRDSVLFADYIGKMEKIHPNSQAELLVETALFFLNTPYVGKTLEQEPERLVVNLRELDCMTFVENVLALSETYYSADRSWSVYMNNLRKIRYRNGVIVDYTSRLHYTTDWIYENEKRGAVKDITYSIGGKQSNINVSYISTHPENYEQLKNNPSLIQVMAEKESEINSRKHFYIPKDEIDNYAGYIYSGDIVCFVTSIKGLDISHVGIIYKTNVGMTFIHASSVQKMVIVNKESLRDYMSRIKNNIGIIVVRPQMEKE